MIPATDAERGPSSAAREALRLASIRTRLRAHEPALVAPDPSIELHAAGALIRHEPVGGAPELLFIERALRDGDPWSGHMAFPGGRRQAEDLDLAATASRETLEEVGFEPAHCLGRLDDLKPTTVTTIPRLIVSAYVFETTQRPVIATSHEVQSAVWVPLDWILAPDSATEYRIQREGGRNEPFPACRYQRYVIWGLTYRILRHFLQVSGREIPLSPLATAYSSSS